MTSLRRYAFPLLLGLGMVVFELGFTFLLVFGQPHNTRWLGDTLQNSSDVAVYLSEVQQGHWLLANLFAVEPHALRFDLVWSTLSAIQGLTHASPILIHEIARVLFTLLLAFAIYTGARSVAKDEQEARIASLLAVGGIGLGWLHSVLLGTGGMWTPTTDAAPDLVTELAVAPVLIGGAHMILSLALLTYVMRGVWEAIHDPQHRVWTVMLAIVALTLFHPYLLPLVAMAALFAWVKQVQYVPDHPHALRNPLLILSSLIPAAAYYVWLLRDPVFSAHHLYTNILPIASFDRWVFVLIPAALALGWILSQHERFRVFFRNSRWCLIWIVSATILTLFLPVPWSRKLTEGLMIPLVFLTLPAWSALLRRLPRFGAGLALAGLVIAAPLHLFASQAVWLASPENATWFNRSTDVFKAWDYLAHQPNAIVTSDDMWTNVWTPAWTGRTVWLGHNHETPNYAVKRAAWDTIMQTDDIPAVRAALDASPVTHFMTTSAESRDRLHSLLGQTWQVVFSAGDVSVFTRVTLPKP